MKDEYYKHKAQQMIETNEENKNIRKLEYDKITKWVNQRLKSDYFEEYVKDNLSMVFK